jgi:octaprenyl-diphosphate synthase
MRPWLVALSADCLGGVAEPHVRVAAIIEMVHLATLVHDDIMDGAEVRRRKPTLAAHWGSEVSVLLGDCLFAHALEMAAGFPTTEVCRAVSASTKTVCTGEILQTHRRGRTDLGREDYLKVIGMKTGELFALSCDLGACLAGASGAERAALRGYGQALGTAYQIFDDCVDVFGREAEAGKSLGTDLAQGKVTLPVLVAFERTRGADGQRLHQMINHWQPGTLPELLSLLGRVEALAESQAVIGRYLGAAHAALGIIAPSASREALERLADLLGIQAEGLGHSPNPARG